MDALFALTTKLINLVRMKNDMEYVPFLLPELNSILPPLEEVRMERIRSIYTKGTNFPWSIVDGFPLTDDTELVFCIANRFQIMPVVVKRNLSMWEVAVFPSRGLNPKENELIERANKCPYTDFLVKKH